LHGLRLGQIEFAMGNEEPQGIRNQPEPASRPADGGALPADESLFLYRLGLSGHGFATQAALRMA
jgi:hypothetical protein